jgi:hypothetical protein
MSFPDCRRDVKTRWYVYALVLIATVEYDRTFTVVELMTLSRNLFGRTESTSVRNSRPANVLTAATTSCASFKRDFPSCRLILEHDSEARRCGS